MNSFPAHDLEQKAAEDRRRLHSSVEELRVHLKESLDIKKNTREHLGLACSVAALMGVTLGYAFTGIFVD
jgi:hypothetical protein